MRVIVGLILAHVIAIDEVDLSFFSGGDKQVRMRTGLISQEYRAAGSQIIITLIELSLIRGRKVINQPEILFLRAQFEDAVSEVAAVCCCIELSISRHDEDVAVIIRRRTGIALPNGTV